MVSLYITFQHVIEMSVPSQFPDLSRSFAHCMYGSSRSQPRSINWQKKNEANIQSSWPNKLGQSGLLHGSRGNFSCRTRRVGLSGQAR